MNRSMHRESLVARLLESGLVSESQVELAETEQRRRGGSLAGMLCDLGFVPPEQLAAAMAREAGISVAQEGQLKLDPELEALVPLEIARRLKILPVARDRNLLTIAMANPFDVVAADQVRAMTGLDVEILAAAERQVLNALDSREQRDPGIQSAIDRWLAEEPSPDASVGLVQEIPTVGEPDAPVVQLVHEIIGRAVEAGASDIHFEPAERWLRIRLRVDGVLVPDVLVPKPLQPAVSARLKVLADLDVAESRIPQDGRCTFIANRSRTHLRVSTLPTQPGESVVLRLLPAESSVPRMDRLGLEPSVETALGKVIRRPNGVTIITGPTGSGKTTTLYALLGELNQPDSAVFTLEDPVEMPLVGVRQTQIHEEAGLTYAAALRALLRQDPDVILVGETRDAETAQLMIRAAMTGHQVLTTLHTNDALGAIPRLTDLGVDRSLLPGTLGAVMAQRLVRRLCLDCRQKVEDSLGCLEAMGIPIPVGPAPEIYRARGCTRCVSTGYRGRRAIFELFVPDEPFHPLIAGPPDRMALLNQARTSGMRTLFEDGLRQVYAGVTSAEELVQVTRMD